MQYFSLMLNTIVYCNVSLKWGYLGNVATYGAVSGKKQVPTGSHANRKADFFEVFDCISLMFITFQLRWVICIMQILSVNLCQILENDLKWTTFTKFRKSLLHSSNSF
jgi:hypothetical protein